jgi:membrane protease YdiL (CAAX protease family)
MPWSLGLFLRREHDWFLPFVASILVLHWLSTILVVLLVYRAGGTLADIGLDVSPGRAALLVGGLLAVGGGLIALRQTWPAAESLDDWQLMYPATLTDRVVWVILACSAGICEELVYRGFAIRVLQGRGWRTWLALALPGVSFVFIHGVFGLFAFPVLFAVALLYGLLFLWRKSLVPCIVLHALFDLMGVLAV